jgi:RNA polymerase sigma-70 factor (ECF subfamily)
VRHVPCTHLATSKTPPDLTDRARGIKSGTSVVDSLRDREDEQVVARCLGGDTAAFAGLVERYERVLFSVALRMLGDAEDARDATQDVFIKVFQRLGDYKPEHRFFSWIYRILTNECLNTLRARRPQEREIPDLAITTGALDALELEERRRAVQAAITALPRDYRDVLILRHFAELSYEEVADTLAIPVKTVKSRLYTARQQLGQRLLGWGEPV